MTLPRIISSKPEVDPLLNVKQLVEASPIDVRLLPKSASRYLRCMFTDTRELVCTGQLQSAMRIANQSEVTGDPRSINLVVPSYMLLRESGGRYQPADKFRRCNANAGSSRFVVFNNPRLTADAQAKKILSLTKIASLVLVVETARGDIEGWFSVVGWSEKEVEQFRRTAIEHGSTMSTLVRSRPYAFPGGACERCNRSNRAIYMNPDAIGTQP